MLSTDFFAGKQVKESLFQLVNLGDFDEEIRGWIPILSFFGIIIQHPTVGVEERTFKSLAWLPFLIAGWKYDVTHVQLSLAVIIHNSMAYGSVNRKIMVDICYIGYIMNE